MSDKNSLKHHLLHPIEDAEPFLERVVFTNRALLVLLFVLSTLFLAYQATKIRPDASFEKMIPTFHPYIANFLEHKEDLKGLGNLVRIAVEHRDGDIFDREYLETLRSIHDEAFFISGVDRSAVKSLWSPAVRWIEVSEEGFQGGPVMPDSYDGSAESLDLLQQNILKSGQLGVLVANDYRSSIVQIPLLETDPETGQAIDYQRFSEQLESLIRDKYQSDNITIHITGFAKVVGDLIDSSQLVVLFFVVAVLITLVLLLAYSRCLKSTLVALCCSVIAVIWQLGLLHSLGYGLDPYSMLVPFLVFAIGVSHGVQIINAISHEAMQGHNKLLSARLAFRSLYIPGLTALFSDGIGFATLLVIEITVIQELAIAASIGVAVIIITNLVLLPVLMSYIGVSQSSVRHLERQEAGNHPIWQRLSQFAGPVWAPISLSLAVVMIVVGAIASQELKIGDLDAGAPELRPDSRYNLDNAFMTENYSSSTDILVVMAKTPPESCSLANNLATIEDLQWQMDQLPGVQSSISLADITKLAITGMNEGNPKWHTLVDSDSITNSAAYQAPKGMFNQDCSLVPIIIYLDDHKAETLSRVVAAVEAYADEHNTDQFQLLLAAGNAGIEASTNIVIEAAQYKMLLWVYGVVSLLCLITFRCLRVVACIILPLALTSLLCQALMSYMGIGVKVATLPVIALGVGIGVDYGIYIYSKLQDYMRQGMDLREAYFHTLKTTGKAVAFTGITLAIGVGTWVFSPIKFQADMGILLTFMFLWNMLGALLIMPALARYLVNRCGAKSPVQHTA